MAASASDYRTKLAQEQQRYGRGPITGRGGTESARDAAVRATNIAMGLGNSTALKYPQNAPPPPPAKTARARGGGDVTSSTASPYDLPGSAPVPKARPSADTGLPGGDVLAGPKTGTPYYDPLAGANTGQPFFNPQTSLSGWNPFGSSAPAANPVPANPAMSQASVLQTLNPALRAPPVNPGAPASVGLGMQPKYPYAMPSPSNVPPHGSLLIPNYGAGVGMPTPPVGGIGGINLFGTGGYGA